jgi:phosphatidylserine decarboxylase
VERGEGLMAFHLGSTVVLLLERPVALAPELVDGAEVRLGAALTV